MARTETDQLVVALEARITQFEKSFERANKSASRSYGQITAGSSRMATKIEGDFNRTGRAAARLGQEMTAFKSSLLGAFGAGFAGGALAGAVAELPRAIQNATKAIADMKAEASRAGVAVGPFQELAFAATQSKIPLDALTDGMKELQLRADEFLSTGKGPAAEAFTRLGYGADDLRDRLKDPIGLFDDIILRLKTFDKAAQIRILDEVFGGTGGERLVTLLDEGARSLDEMRGRARELGVVLSDDVVEKAAELDARFNEVAATIDSRVKTALVGTAGVIADIADAIAALDKSLGEMGNAPFWDSLRRFMGVSDEDAARGNIEFQVMRRANGQAPTVPDYADVRQSATGGSGPAVINITADKMSGLEEKLQAAVRQLVADAQAAGHAITVTSGLRSTARQRQLWQEAIAKYGSPAAARQFVAPPGSSRHEKGAAVDIAFPDRAAREWVAANMGAYGLAAPVPTETPLGTRHAHLELAGERGSGAGARDEAAEAAKRQAEAYRQVTRALDDERAVIGLTAEQARLYNELRAAGVTLDSEQGKVIAEKVHLLYQQQAAQDALVAAQERANESAEQMAGLARDAVGGLITDLRNGVSAADAMASALDRITGRLIDMALDSIFTPQAMGGLLGSLFGGSAATAGAPMNLLPRAGGGPVRRGMPYPVGERGPELFVPNSHGAIIPNSRAMGAAGRGGDANVSVNVINASGEKVETRERRTDLGRTVEVMVGKALGSGKFDKPMGARYGAQPVKTRRG